MGFFGNLFNGGTYTQPAPIASPEQFFLGIPESVLDDLARQCYRGTGAEVQGDKLIYHYTSTSGKTRESGQIWVGDDCTLTCWPYRSYPGQTFPREYDLMVAIYRYLGVALIHHNGPFGPIPTDDRLPRNYDQADIQNKICERLQNPV